MKTAPSPAVLNSLVPSLVAVLVKFETLLCINFVFYVCLLHAVAL